MTAPKRRRKRGVILTQSGLERFQTAKINAEQAFNRGQRYTLDNLSELTGIGLDTLSKALGCQTRVDVQTLKYCFQAFELELMLSDYCYPEDTSLKAARGAVKSSFCSRAIPLFSPPTPGGQLPSDASIYIRRDNAEADSFLAIEQPGSLIRIRGARQTGKTSLMVRIARQAQQLAYQPIYISFQLADKPILQDLDQLLRWFCVSVGLEMGLSPSLKTYWDLLFGSKVSCKLYFEQYLLPSTDRPIVLILDDVDRLFHHLDVADEFFGLLRTWYEDAKTSDSWKKVRMVISQSSDSYIPLNINKSPFNMGVEIRLLPFSPEDVSMLSDAYGLSWSLASATELCRLVEGHPYLTHLAVDCIWRKDASLSELLSNPVECPIFSAYLQQQLYQVQQQPQLSIALSQVLTNQFSIPPTLLTDIHKLQSMGLIVLEDHSPRLACDLFTRYFSTALASEP